MANNRIGIACVCGGYVLLAKRYLDGYYTSVDDAQAYADRLDAFFDAHKHCVPAAAKLPTANVLDNTDQDNLALVYENPSFAGQQAMANAPAFTLPR